MLRRPKPCERPAGLGKTAEGIPLGSRIIFACDAFDAMTSQRVYRASRTQAEAIAELRRCADS
jgi:HD-GYP domain-containing protein (c-di-GMP phosphodiesterase class II)